MKPFKARRHFPAPTGERHQHRGPLSVNPVLWIGPSLATFAVFMVCDPQPSLMLSVSVGLNMALGLWALIYFYRQGLLLAPMAGVFLGNGMLIFYTWGNLGARMAGEGRLVSNPGSLEYYPVAAMLCAVGLLLYVAVIYFYGARRPRLAYGDLYWKPWQAPAAAAFAGAIILYLSWKYAFSGGYFREVDSTVDRWLASAQYFFLYLSTIIGVSVVVKAKNRQSRIMGIAALAFVLLLAVGMRSRTAMVNLVILSIACWVTLEPRRVQFALVTGAVAASLIFALGTVVKLAKGDRDSVYKNLETIQQQNMAQITEKNQMNFEGDSQYRMAGFEFPAALLQGYDHGAATLEGAGMAEGLIQGFPRFIRDYLAGQENLSERHAIGTRFKAYGLVYDDSIGVPLSSGLADWGMVGSLIYPVIAAYCLFLWWLMQKSPFFFVATLMIGPVVTDLFWDNCLYAFRGIAFCLIVLVLLKGLLMPRSEAHAGHTAKTSSRPLKSRFRLNRAPRRRGLISPR